MEKILYKSWYNYVDNVMPTVVDRTYCAMDRALNKFVLFCHYNYIISYTIGG